MDRTMVDEKIRVFVSSTIKECSAEREVAKSAIASLNHQPFLFEAAGARPAPPPELFFKKLDESHIFIGIYKDSFGWIAPSATQSGLEQEFERARERGVKRLFYIARDGRNRDPRLVEMLNSASEEVTFSYYDDPGSLYERIRDDIEAVVTETFHQATQISSALKESAETIAPVSSGAQLELRPGLMKKIADAQKVAAINVSGESGTGKTYQLVALAREHNGIYVSGRGYGRHLLASVIVNAVRKRQGLTAEYFVSPEESFTALMELWDDDNVPTMLYLDDVEDELFLARILHEGKPMDSVRALVTTSPEATNQEGFQVFVLERVEANLARQFLGHCTSSGAFPRTELEQRSSFGNPLFLHYLCRYPRFGSCASLYDLEAEIFGEMRQDVQELIAYVALSGSNLEMQEASLATGWKPHLVLAAASKASPFLRETDLGFELRHSHQRETILSILEKLPVRRKYLQRRLAKALNKRKSPLRAFLLLEALGDPEASRFAPAALFEAGVRGDNKSVLRVANRRLAAEKNLSPEAHVALLLSKSMAERQGGNRDESARTLEQAKIVAEATDDAELIRDVRFLEKYEAVYRSLQQEDLLELEAILASVDTNQEAFARGRYAVDLSALYMHLNLQEKAAEHAREALDLFHVVGDEYGEMTARKNLVTALTKGSGDPGEIAQLSKELEAYWLETDSIRDRAWLCNLRTRQCRLAGKLDQAHAYALEAIEIAHTLGDARLVALNRINLGNVLRDQDLPKDAVREYLEACRVAAGVGDRHMEVQSSRLAAAAYVDAGDLQAALSSAEYAVARIDGTTAADAMIDALEQLGEVQNALRDFPAAADAFGKAFERSRIAGRPDSNLLLEHLQASSNSKSYMKAVLRLLDAEDRGATEATDNVDIILKGYELLLRLSGGENLLELTELHLKLPNERLDLGAIHVLFERLLSIAAATGDDVVRAAAMLSLFVSIPLEGSSMLPLIEASGKVSDHLSELSFRTHSDGAARWTISLKKGHPILISLAVVDDRASSNLIAVAVVLFLWKFEKELKEQLLAGMETPKREVHVMISHVDELPADLRSAIPDPEHGVSVSRVSYPTALDSTPTMVFYNDLLMKSFRLVSGETSGLLKLLLFTLRELCHQLFLGEVEEAELTPKIVKLLRHAFQ